jgi:predicted flap endonuclease-1-like 5' DNA nuclease
MNPFVIFVLGLLIGWLVEWIIDWFYYRRRNAADQGRADENSRSRVAELEQEVASYQNQLASLQAQREAAAVATAAAAPAPVAPEAVAPEPVVINKQSATGSQSAPGSQAAGILAEPESLAGVEPIQTHDSLEEIHGVSPELARKLHEAGIYTFAELGALRPYRLREIAGDTLEFVGAEVEIVQQARLAAGTMKQVDDLEIIDGIGPVISKILNNAGIFTFADLSVLTQEDLREIVGERIQRLANEEKILVQARRLAERLD